MDLQERLKITQFINRLNAKKEAGRKKILQAVKKKTWKR